MMVQQNMSAPPPQMVPGPQAVEMTMLGAPAQNQMGGAGGKTSVFGTGNRITVQQLVSKRSCIEIFTAWDLNNRYELTTADGRVYYMKEDTNCLCRQFLKQHRAWKVHMFDSADRSGGGRILYTGDKQSATLHDVCPCYFFAACRPEMRVTNGEGEKVGWVQDPFACCHTTELVKGPDNKDMYKISGFDCQVGMWCPICADVEMDITNVADTKEGNGRFIKRAGGCYELCCGDIATKIEIELPKDCDTDDKKALLVMTSMMLDMTYFEDNNAK